MMQRDPAGAAQFEELINDKTLNEADDREVISHGLDFIGVKASTANTSN